MDKRNSDLINIEGENNYEKYYVVGVVLDNSFRRQNSSRYVGDTVVDSLWNVNTKSRLETKVTIGLLF